MKQLIFLLSLTLISLTSFSQTQLKINVELKQTDAGVELFAISQEIVPVTILMNYSLDNLALENEEKQFVLQPNAEPIQVATISVVDKTKPVNMNYGFSSKIGLPEGNELNKDFAYSLPFAKEKSYKMSQGYGGKFSHQKDKAIDFTMDEGEPVHAMRSGIITKVVDHFYQNCLTLECEPFNNYIYVYHEDGTMAEYVHLMQNGAAVKEGDKVKQGDYLGKSGNVGFSSGPHLHVSIFVPNFKGRTTLETEFKISENEVSQLKENVTYTRDYD